MMFSGSQSSRARMPTCGAANLFVFSELLPDLGSTAEAPLSNNVAAATPHEPIRMSWKGGCLSTKGGRDARHSFR